MRTIVCILCLGLAWTAQAQFATITHEVENDFARYKPYHSQVQPAVLPYLSGEVVPKVEHLDQAQLTENQKQDLLQQGFIAQPSEYRQLYDLYNSLRDRNMPLFVTTDAVLHTFHILYDYTLRMLEVDAFVADLERLTDEMLAISQTQLAGATTPLAQEAASRNVGFFQVANALLGNQNNGLTDAARQELAQIRERTGILPSALFQYPEDYTQYIPRGHYTRNEMLERFFLSMMWYGRMGFRRGTDDPDIARLETLQAILITAGMQDAERQRLWDRIYEPTVFFVGKADDLTLYQYQQVAMEVYGTDFAALSPDTLGEGVDVFIERAEALPPPQINASIIADSQDFQKVTHGFRFMGQRFIPDSYILFQMVHRRVPGRFFPRGLDVMAVLGSRRAYDILVDLYDERRHPDYQNQLAKLQDEFAAFDDTTWAQNLYWNWLYALMPLLDENREGYPAFMQYPAWADKELATALGSWAELRHDTILYAKQGYAELTSIPILPAFTRGYVEPNPELYGRFASLAGMLRSGLEARGLTVPAFSDRLERLEQLLLDLKTISETELSAQSLTEAQYRVIWGFGETLEYLNSFPPDVSQQVEGEEDRDMAVAADVHTDPNSGQVLEEGVGHPLLLSVIVPDGDSLKLVQGGMFSYYEFPYPMNDRLTDAKWQGMVGQHTPRLPAWMDSFVRGAGVEERPQQSQRPRWDINSDGLVDVVDMVHLALHFGGSTQTRRAWLDMNRDGVVDILDLVVIGRHFGEKVTRNAPPATPISIAPTSEVRLERQDSPEKTLVSLRVPPNWDVRGVQFDASFAAGAELRNVTSPHGDYVLPGAIGPGQMSGFAALSTQGDSLHLEGVLARLEFAPHQGVLALRLREVRIVDSELNVRAVGEVTLAEHAASALTFSLLPNFPNPFNPETWIPYALPEQLPVSLRIYDITGRLVRTIDVGIQPAGYHDTRESAIHWDGRNNAGEPVAGGSYFYQLSAGEHSQQRRMILLK